MKALVEIEITGDFEEPLINEDVIDILNFVICEGAEAGHLDGKYRIIQVYKEGASE